MKDNEKITLPAELTPEELKDYGLQAVALAESLKVSKVHPVVFIETESGENKRIVAYLREPNYATKLAVMDKSVTSGIFTAADELRQAILIKEESDPLTYGEHDACSEAKLGVTEHCLSIVKRLNNQFKKK